MLSEERFSISKLLGDILSMNRLNFKWEIPNNQKYFKHLQIDQEERKQLTSIKHKRPKRKTNLTCTSLQHPNSFVMCHGRVRSLRI